MEMSELRRARLRVLQGRKDQFGFVEGERGGVALRPPVRAIERSADQEDGRRLHARQRIERPEGGGSMLLARRSGMRNNHSRNGRVETRFKQFFAQSGEIVSGHIDDQGCVVACEALPIRLLFGIGQPLLGPRRGI